jgi:mono/diheme cytochrome c family protein
LKKLLAVALFLVTLSREARADDGRRIVHLLEYVARDYARAMVSRATYPREHDEQLEILDVVKPMIAALAPRVSGGSEALERLRREVRELASPALVKALAEELALRVAEELGIDRLPASTADRARGRALYLEHCAPCHGAFGDADTARARSLDPPPTSFVTTGVELTPERIRATAAFGIPNTAMVGFQFLDDGALWDLGFFVMSLRHRERSATVAPRYAPIELANKSDAALAAELFAAGAAERALSGMMAELRTRQSFAPAVDPLATLRDRLTRARQALAWGDRSLAARALRAAHVEGLVPARAALGAAAGSYPIEIDERLMLLRSRLPHEPIVDLRRDASTLLARIAVAEMAALGKRPGSFWAGLQLGASLVLVPLAGIIAALALLGRGFAAGVRRHAALGATLVMVIVAWQRLGALPPLSGGVHGVWLLAISSAMCALASMFAWLSRARALPRWTSRSDLAFAVSFAWCLRPALQGVDRITLRAIDASLAEIGGVATALGMAMMLAREGSILLDRLSERHREPIAGVLAAAAVAVIAGDACWSLQIVGAVPSHAYPWIGVPVLGVHPAREAVISQSIAGVLGLAWVAASFTCARAAPARRA